MEDRVESYRKLSFLKTLREGIDGDDEGEGKFGLTPPSPNPNDALSKATQSKEDFSQEMPRSHPLLSKSAQFSGVDHRLTADPSKNKNAREQYPQLRLQQQLKKQQKYRQRQSPPRFTRY